MAKRKTWPIPGEDTTHKACKRPTITSALGRQIEQRAMALYRAGVYGAKLHANLTAATREVLGCKPPRALPAEGSLNYFKRIGRFTW